MTNRFEHLICATIEINKYWHKLAANEMEKYGLKAPHSIYFTVLSKNSDKGLTAAQLCSYCGRDKADVSRMMSIMEKNGLVKKEGINQNYYNGVFKLTDEGRKIADYVDKKVNSAVELAGKDLSDGERTVFYRALDAITANLKELSAKGIPEK